MKKPKILFYDVENTPNEIYAWGVREQNAIAVKRHWEMLSFAYQWMDSGPITVVSREGQATDERLIRKLHAVLSKADVVIAHNGLQFDNKKSNARFLKYGLPPVRPFKTIDTLRVAQASFNMNSCSLDSLANYLNIGSKLKHAGFDMWLGCINDDAKSWKSMRKYNAHDIVLLRGVYEKLLPWLPAAVNVVQSEIKQCPRPGCGGLKFVSNGIRYTSSGVAYRRLQCTKCGGWAREAAAVKTLKLKSSLRSL